MSMPVAQQSPPTVTLPQQSYGNHTGHTSFGPVIAVMVLIIILGVLAVMVGRVCSGRRIMGYGEYDIEGWAERKCSSCIDGRINPSPPRSQGSATSTPGTMPVHHAHEGEEEAKPEDQSPQNPPPSADS